MHVVFQHCTVPCEPWTCGKHSHALCIQERRPPSRPSARRSSQQIKKRVRAKGPLGRLTRPHDRGCTYRLQWRYAGSCSQLCPAPISKRDPCLVGGDALKIEGKVFFRVPKEEAPQRRSLRPAIVLGLDASSCTLELDDQVTGLDEAVDAFLHFERDRKFLQQACDVPCAERILGGDTRITPGAAEAATCTGTLDRP